MLFICRALTSQSVRSPSGFLSIYTIVSVRPFSEEASLVTSLQDELKNLKEEMVKLRNTHVSVLVDDSAFRAPRGRNEYVMTCTFPFQQSDGSAELALLQNR